ncbi:MAG: BamA/TamA family outer membrane protein [Deltaproteobacteria bacterium]|nr:BamA/TamA family outer membrane protein [Deltaproteobacteria bacterium]
MGLEVGRRWGLRSILIGCALILGAGKVAAQSPPMPTPVPTPLAETATQAKLPEPRPEIFPLAIPYYVLKGVTYPVSKLAHVIEKNKYSRRSVGLVINKDRNFSVYPILTVGDGRKFGGGLGISAINLFHQPYVLKTDFILYQDLDQRASFSISNDAAFRVFDRNFSFEFLSTWYKDGDEDFFGIGPDTSESNKSEFGLQRFVIGTRFGFELIHNLSLSPRIFFDTALSNNGHADFPDSVEANFPPSELAGFGRTISYLDFGFRLAHDDRDPDINPRHGGLRELTFHRFMGVGQKGFDYFQWDVDVEQYFQLWHPRLVLWLHNGWTFQKESGGSQIPFYRLAELDVNSPLRGFDKGRFRDRGSVVFNVEFRYPIWDNVDGTVFFDTGRVFDGISNFAFKDFKLTGGGGLRVTVNEFYLFKLEVATGGEGVNVIFRAVQNL